MKFRPLYLLYLACFLLLLASVGCRIGILPEEVEGTPPPIDVTVESSPVIPIEGSPTPQEALPSPLPPTETLAPESTQPPAETASPAAPEECSEEVCVYDGTFYLKRPIGSDGRNTVVYSERFGSYQKAIKSSLHGAYFLNSTGTPVLATANGEVVVAGDDSRTAYGLFRNMYGNLVILKHDLSGVPQTLFTLYAHLSQVSVEIGDTVEAGQEIGLVGMSGNVMGSILRLELRLGENSYQAVRNPELWLEPLQDETGQLQGGLAGRVIDANGNYIPISNIVVERLAGPGMPAMDQIYLKTYAEKRLNGQSPWGESFAAGDLPAGEYQISFWQNGLQQRVVEVLPGKLTLITFQLE